MKRIGYLMEKMAQWDNLVESEKCSTKRKRRNRGVQAHIPRRIKNLVEIQQSILTNSMKTGHYVMVYKVSGQKKMRKIAKLLFHPNHIQQQSMVMAAEERVEKRLISNTYASRRGYGQMRGALKVRKWIRTDKEGTRWYGQGDLVKCYDSTNHNLIRDELNKFIKDKKFVDAYIEPLTAYAPEGVSIPIGSRISQQAINLALSCFDRYVLEELRPRHYIRYLDDFIIFDRTKGEVKRKMRLAEEFLKGMGYSTHTPKIHALEHQRLDFLGYVTTSTGSMFWRTSDKKNYLKRRAKVTNPRRIKELDDAAKGMLKWGNKHCKALYKMTTGISLEKLGITPRPRTDKDGKEMIDLPRVQLSSLVGKDITVMHWVRGVNTQYGEDRIVLVVERYGDVNKVITNALGIKSLIEDIEDAGITRFSGRVVCVRPNAYDIERDSINVEAINGRDVELDSNGEVVYRETKEKIDKNKK